MIFLTETRIYSKPTINANIPDYTFLHKSTPTKAGGVGAFVSNNLKFSEIESWSVDIKGCEEFDLKLSYKDRDLNTFLQ